MFHKTKCLSQISSIQSVIASATSSYNINNFKHPVLTNDELFQGTRLGFDSWADTSCAGKHAFVDSFVEGRSVNASGFTHALGSIKNLPIANVIYAYDCSDGTTVMILNIYEGNNKIL